MIISLQEYKARKEARQNKNWKLMTPSQRHFALMYLYRIKTDLEHIKDYVETRRFIDMNISVDGLPEYVHRMTPLEIRREAYQVIGKIEELPDDKEPA